MILICSLVYLVGMGALSISAFLTWITSIGSFSRFAVIAACVAMSFALVAIAINWGLPAEVRGGPGYVATKITLEMLRDYILVVAGCVATAKLLYKVGNASIDGQYQPLFILRTKGWWKATTLSAIAVIVFSSLLFLLTEPGLSADAKALVADSPASLDAYRVYLLLATLSVKEELCFRFFLQNLLSRAFGSTNRAHAGAIAVSTLLWTLGHAGVMEPNWVKFAQVAPVGMLLGWLNVRYGILSSIIVHLTLNTILIPLSPILISSAT